MTVNNNINVLPKLIFHIIIEIGMIFNKNFWKLASFLDETSKNFSVTLGFYGAEIRVLWCRTQSSKVPKSEFYGAKI